MPRKLSHQHPLIRRVAVVVVNIKRAITSVEHLNKPRAESAPNNKLVIINFDDSHQSDYTYAKPILDKNGFKATFFEVCNWVEAGSHESDISTTWQQISALEQDGMDIEAHTMNHSILNDLSSQADLDYEIGQSKQCLENHGFLHILMAEDLIFQRL